MIKRILVVTSIAAFVAGCDKPEGTGGVITATVVESETGTVTMETLYGYSMSNNRIAFSIFTNIRAEDVVSTIAGSWSGQIVRKEGGEEPILVFEALSDGISINGTQYSFENGRIFLALYTDGNFVVQQLDIQIGDADHETEISRLGGLEDIQNFLKN